MVARGVGAIINVASLLAFSGTLPPERPRTSAIDIGRGTLGVLPLLCSRVGQAGRVVDLELEPRLLAVADQLAAEHGLTIEIVQADATSTGLPAD